MKFFGLIELLCQLKFGSFLSPKFIDQIVNLVSWDSLGCSLNRLTTDWCLFAKHKVWANSRTGLNGLTPSFLHYERLEALAWVETLAGLRVDFQVVLWLCWYDFKRFRLRSREEFKSQLCSARSSGYLLIWSGNSLWQIYCCDIVINFFSVAIRLLFVRIWGLEQRPCIKLVLLMLLFLVFIVFEASTGASTVDLVYPCVYESIFLGLCPRVPRESARLLC